MTPCYQINETLTNLRVLIAILNDFPKTKHQG